LKIDRSFIQNITRDLVDKAMVNSMVSVAYTMGVKVTAELIEIDKVLSVVKQLEIEFGQGYRIHRPELLTEN
jgi:EAL domain-containing protein (putative c-di-GMP-specific phosphodiesterase class I)